jgi:hypothetical protein
MENVAAVARNLAEGIIGAGGIDTFNRSKFLVGLNGIGMDCRHGVLGRPRTIDSPNIRMAYAFDIHAKLLTNDSNNPYAALLEAVDSSDLYILYFAA